MAHQNRFNRRGGKKTTRKARPNSAERTPIEIPQRRQPTVYGKPFIILEDAHKTTFEYRGGGWVPYGMSMSECRAEGEVKELPQKINNMTRYEVRLPVADEH